MRIWHQAAQIFATPNVQEYPKKCKMCARTAKKKKVPHLPVLEDGFLFVDQKSEIFVDQESEMRGCSGSERELQET